MEATFTQHIDDIARQEIKHAIDNSSTINDYFLLDRYTAAEKLSMKDGYFYKYIYGTPEERSVRRYPVDPRTGKASNKPYYRPEELKRAISMISRRWEIK